MRKSKPFTFDDRSFPTNNLTPERAAEIEKLALPLLEEAFKKLRSEQPHLFKSKNK